MNGDSKYYVKSGFLCIYFPITDPGQPGEPSIHSTLSERRTIQDAIFQLRLKWICWWNTGAQILLTIKAGKAQFHTENNSPIIENGRGYYPDEAGVAPKTPGSYASAHPRILIAGAQTQEPEAPAAQTPHPRTQDPTTSISRTPTPLNPSTAPKDPKP